MGPHRIVQKVIDWLRAYRDEVDEDRQALIDIYVDELRDSQYQAQARGRKSIGESNMTQHRMMKSHELARQLLGILARF